MNYKLIYDVASMSEAPRQALLLGLVILAAIALALLIQFFKKNWRVLPLKFLLLVATVIFAIAGGLEYEKRWIADQARSHGRIVAGPVAGYWTQRERRRSGNSYSTYEWEGFSVGDQSFSYRRNVGQNYFHNPGPDKVDIHDGMMVRVQYLLREINGKPYPEIVRFEVARP